MGIGIPVSSGGIDPSNGFTLNSDQAIVGDAGTEVYNNTGLGLKYYGDGSALTGLLSSQISGLIDPTGNMTIQNGADWICSAGDIISNDGSSVYIGNDTGNCHIHGDGTSITNIAWSSLTGTPTIYDPTLGFTLGAGYAITSPIGNIIVVDGGGSPSLYGDGSGISNLPVPTIGAVNSASGISGIDGTYDPAMVSSMTFSSGILTSIS